MLAGETILLLSCTKWAQWRWPHETSVRLSGQNKVAFVEPSPLFGDGLRAFRQCFAQPKWVRDRLVVLPAPPLAPFHVPLASQIAPRATARLAVKLGKSLHAAVLRRQLRSLGLRPSIVFFYLPYDRYLLGQFGEELTCYRVFDEVALWPTFEPVRDVIAQMDREATGASDLVFSSARSQTLSRADAKTFFIPFGVNFPHFNSALESDLPVPDDLAEIRHPIVGCVGSLDWRIDYDLIARIAQRRDWSVVLVGPSDFYQQDKVKRLSAEPNVHFLGPKRFEDLPRYLKRFDVCIVPYRVGPDTNTMRIYKVNEYLAAGKPVVSVDLFEMQPYRGIVCLAGSTAEFVGCVENELATNSAAKVAARVETAGQNSWDLRVGEMEQLMASALNDRRRDRTPAGIRARRPVKPVNDRGRTIRG